MMELDLLDRKILFELDTDSRQSVSDLAKKVRLGRDLVQYRMQRFLDQKVVQGYSALVNPYKLGLTVYKTYLKVELNRDRLDELISRLHNDPKTYWLAECHGRWDLVFSILARTPLEFYLHQDKLLSDFRDIVLGFNVYTLVNYWWFPRKYLLGDRWDKQFDGWKFETPQFTFGSTPSDHLLDPLETKLLHALSAQGRLGVSELAEHLEASPAVVRYRLDKLIEKGVVAGARVTINQDVLGTTLFKVLVHLRDYDRAKEEAFRNFCRQHYLVTCYIQQIGDCRLEFEAEVKNYQQFYQLMDEVRERFSKYIKFTEYMVVHKDYHHRLRYPFEEADPISSYDTHAGRHHPLQEQQLTSQLLQPAPEEARPR